MTLSTRFARDWKIWTLISGLVWDLHSHFQSTLKDNRSKHRRDAMFWWTQVVLLFRQKIACIHIIEHDLRKRGWDQRQAWNHSIFRFTSPGCHAYDHLSVDSKHRVDCASIRTLTGHKDGGNGYWHVEREIRLQIYPVEIDVMMGFPRHTTRLSSDDFQVALIAIPEPADPGRLTARYRVPAPAWSLVACEQAHMLWFSMLLWVSSKTLNISMLILAQLRKHFNRPLD
jgi:hypothetical protein